VKALYKKFLDNRASFWVSALVIGPFALPLLWRDQRYTKTAKVVISILLSIVTLLLIWVNIEMAKYSSGKLGEAMDLMHTQSEDN
jgi:hypothetical protein